MQLTRLPQAPSNLVWSPDGQWLAFSMRVPEKPPTMGVLPNKPEGANWAEPPRVVKRISFRRDGSGMLPQGFDHVFLVAAGGGAVRQLSHGDFPQGGNISWAADSRSVYFVGNRQPDYALDSQNSEIYQVGIEGGEITAITSKPGPDRSVRVAPDGAKLAWLGFEDRRLSHQLVRIYVMPTDG
jgi:Tol biopolymer transport system component